MSQPIIIRVFKDGELVKVKQFADQQQIVIGASGGGIHLDLEGISPIHAAIERRDDGFAICDLGSEKGTFKDGKKVLDEALYSGDKIELGDYTLEFSVAGMESVEAEGQRRASDQPGFDEVTVPAFQASAGGAMSTYPTSKKGKTFAPPSAHKNIRDCVKPTKGTNVEIIVAWKERIISTHHFSEKGTVTIGTHPKSDIVVPLISSGVNQVPIVNVDSLANLILHPTFDGEIIGETGSTPFSALSSAGRSAGGSVQLRQGEMALVHLSEDVSIVVRYASQAPKPLVMPFFDFSSNGFLTILLAIVIASILALFVALNAQTELEKDREEDKYRSALIITNPPKPPPRVKIDIKPEPPKPKKKKVKPVVKKVKPKKKKVKPKPKTQVAKKKPKKPDRKRPVVKKKPKKSGGARGSKVDGKAAKSRRPKPGPVSKKTGSSQQGGSKKTTKKPTAGATSKTKDPKKSGIFSVFGTSGSAQRTNKDYMGAKNGLAGIGDKATGKSGFSNNRAGKGLGSRFKETGATGKGRSNEGVSGLGRGKGLGGGGSGLGSGFGSGSGLGDRRAVSIDVGGSGAEYDGSIDKEAIRRVMLNNQRAIRSCYERDLNQNSKLGGKLYIEFDIGEHGRVSNAKSLISKSTMKSRTVANCIVSRLRTWRFPDPPRNQVVGVIYPFAFAPK